MKKKNTVVFLICVGIPIAILTWPVSKNIERHGANPIQPKPNITNSPASRPETGIVDLQDQDKGESPHLDVSNLLKNVDEPTWRRDLDEGLYELSTKPIFSTVLALEDVTCRNDACQISGRMYSSDRAALKLYQLMEEMKANNRIVGEQSERHVVLDSLTMGGTDAPFKLRIQSDDPKLYQPSVNQVFEAFEAFDAQEKSKGN
ncbi:MAG: hypothetical protein ACK4E7_02870 [Permianibacter sp.]